MERNNIERDETCINIQVPLSALKKKSSPNASLDKENSIVTHRFNEGASTDSPKESCSRGINNPHKQDNELYWRGFKDGVLMR